MSDLINRKPLETKYYLENHKEKLYELTFLGFKDREPHNYIYELKMLYHRDGSTDIYKINNIEVDEKNEEVIRFQSCGGHGSSYINSFIDIENVCLNCGGWWCINCKSMTCDIKMGYPCRQKNHDGTLRCMKCSTSKREYLDIDMNPVHRTNRLPHCLTHLSKTYTKDNILYYRDFESRIMDELTLSIDSIKLSMSKLQDILDDISVTGRVTNVHIKHITQELDINNRRNRIMDKN